MSNEPHDPTRSVGPPAFSAPTVPGTGPGPAAGQVEFRAEPGPAAAPYGAPPAAPPAFAPAPAPYAQPPGFAPHPGAPAAPNPYAPQGYAGETAAYADPPQPAPAPYGQPAPPPAYAPASYGDPVAPPLYSPAPYGQPAPSPYVPAPAPVPYGQPQQPAPYGQPYLPTPGPTEYRPAPPELADQIPGAVAHDGYTDERFTRHQLPGDEKPKKRESAWNAPALGMLALFLIALIVVIWPQYKARSTEHALKPLVVGLVGHESWARCPRYITSVFTYVGAVTMDGKGRLSDHTELTGPICKGLRHLYTPAGRAEMRCLTTDGLCSQTAMNSVIALSTITHESMHLKGELDEGKAECTSIGEASHAAVLAGLTPEEGRMIGYLHMTGMNPDTPPQYRVTTQNCPAVVDLLRDPPADPSMRARLTNQASDTWRDIARG